MDESIEPAGYLAATRTAYDTVAADYAGLLRDELAGRPVDRAALAAFAELVRATGARPGRWPRRAAGQAASRPT